MNGIKYALEILENELKSRKRIFAKWSDKSELNKIDYDRKNKSLQIAIKFLKNKAAKNGN